MLGRPNRISEPLVTLEPVVAMRRGIPVTVRAATGRPIQGVGESFSESFRSFDREPLLDDEVALIEHVFRDAAERLNLPHDPLGGIADEGFPHDLDLAHELPLGEIAQLVVCLPLTKYR